MRSYFCLYQQNNGFSERFFKILFYLIFEIDFKELGARALFCQTNIKNKQKTPAQNLAVSKRLYLKTQKSIQKQPNEIS